LIFRKAAAGELRNDGLLEIYRHVQEVDVDAEGVKGAKNFFEAKVPLYCTSMSHVCCAFAQLLLLNVGSVV